MDVDTPMSRRHILSILVAFSASSCEKILPVSDRRIEVSNDRLWWGDLDPNVFWELKENVILEHEALITQTRFHGGIVYAKDIEKINKESPTGLYVVNKGTQIKLLGLERAMQTTFNYYNIKAEILNGEHKGKRVSLHLMTKGDVNEKGSLRPDAAYLKPVL